MILPSKIQFADEKVKDAFETLKNSSGEEKQLYAWLARAFKDIEQNAFCGLQIPKKLLPEEYAQKFNIDNLWKYNLPNAWRLIYAVKGNGIIVISVILEWFDHKNYERRFNY